MMDTIIGGALPPARGGKGQLSVLNCVDSVAWHIKTTEIWGSGRHWCTVHPDAIESWGNRVYLHSWGPEQQPFEQIKWERACAVALGPVWMRCVLHCSLGERPHFRVFHKKLQGRLGVDLMSFWGEDVEGPKGAMLQLKKRYYSIRGGWGCFRHDWYGSAT